MAFFIDQYKYEVKLPLKLVLRPIVEGTKLPEGPGLCDSLDL